MDYVWPSSHVTSLGVAKEIKAFLDPYGAKFQCTQFSAMITWHDTEDAIHSPRSHGIMLGYYKRSRHFQCCSENKLLIFFSHLSTRCVSTNTYNKFIISHTHHIQYNANWNAGATCFDRLWSSSGPVFELVQVLFKIYIVRSGIPCAYTSSYEQAYLYLKF